MPSTEDGNNAADKTSVLVPLYYYPLTKETWRPLYDAIATYPQVDFLVIVNPNSGPGNAPLPGPDYVREVPRLNAYPNVRTIGYVKVDWCRRPLAESCHDVQLYADWKQKHEHEFPGLYVEGIFVDETPNHYSDDRLAYLDALGQFIKDADGLQGDRMIMHNPGTPPDADMAPLGRPDAICTCEEPWPRFQGDEVQTRLRDYYFERSRSAYQISGIPSEQIAVAVRKLSRTARYIFATDLVEDFYESFSQTSWENFVAAIVAVNEARYSQGACEGDSQEELQRGESQAYQGQGRHLREDLY